MYDLASQVDTLTKLVIELRRQLHQVADVAANAAQNIQMTPAGGDGGGGGQQGFIGKATVNIAARSGASLGAGGNVAVYQDGGGTLTAVGTSVTARCSVSRTTAGGNGIDINTWCWVEIDPYGTYWASPLDCT